MVTTILLFAVLMGKAQNSSSTSQGEAARALTSYQTNPAENKAKLQLAKEKIDEAFKDKKLDKDAKALFLKGEIYQELFKRELINRQLGLGKEFSPENFGYVSMTAFMNTYKISDPGTNLFKDALKNITGLQADLMSGLGYLYEDQKFEPAYLLGKSMLESTAILQKNKITSSLYEVETFNSVIGAAWFLSQKTGRAAADADFFREIISGSVETKAGYAILYEIATMKNDLKKAAELARAGYDKFPEDVTLLFNLINALMQQKDFEALVPALKKGIAQEPENAGLYFAMGQAYDALYQQAAPGGNQDKANGYFKEAVNYYTQAAGKNPRSTDPLYSLGALYYNKASLLQAAGANLSGSDAEEKRNKLLPQIVALFDQALPWFQKVEALDPNDMGTLTGLFNIYNWKGDALAAEFKKRAEKVQAGGRNTSSYFRK